MKQGKHLLPVGRMTHWGIMVCCCAAFMLFGYDQGVMSGLLTGVAFTKQFPEINTTTGNGSSSLQGTVVAIYEIGCFFGSITAFAGMGDWLGRRKTIAVGCTILIIGSILQFTSYGIPQLIVGRIVTGIGNGINTSTVPMFHSECAQGHDRGRAVATECIVLIFGVALAYWVDYGFSFVQSEAQFRVPLALQIVFALVAMILLPLVPESPRWLIGKGRFEDAHYSLWRLSNLPASEEKEAIVEAEFQDIRETLIAEAEALPVGKDGKRVSPLRACFMKKDRMWLRTLLGIGGQFMQQMSGINLITYYIPVVLETSVHLERNLSLILAGCNGIAYFLSSIPPFWLLDRVGRRKLLLFSAIGQCFCMVILAGTTSTTKTSAGIVAVVMLFLFNFFFANGFLAIPWLLPAEYAPLAIRASAAGLASASDWIWNFVVVEITPISFTNIGYQTYIIFAVMNAAFVPLIYFFYPECAGLTLEECDVLWEGEKYKLFYPDDRPRAVAADIETHGRPLSRPGTRTGAAGIKTTDDEKRGAIGHIERQGSQSSASSSDNMTARPSADKTASQHVVKVDL